MENHKNKLKSEIEAEPPKIVKHIKWLLLYGKDHKGIICIAIIFLLIVFFSGDIKKNFIKKTIDSPSKTESINPKKNTMDSVPDVTRAKKEILITSQNQLKQRSNLYDVSTTVPGYFEFTASPSSDTYSNSCVNTKDIVIPNYYASVRVAGLQGATVLDFNGRGVTFGLSTITNRYYIYESEENWTTWRDLKFKKDDKINTLSIYQKERKVSVFLNGVFVANFTKIKKAEPGPISLCFKANPKSGGRIHFQKLSIWEF